MYHDGKDRARLMCTPLEGRTMSHKFFKKDIMISHPVVHLDVRYRPIHYPVIRIDIKPYISQIRICAISVVDRGT